MENRARPCPRCGALNGTGFDRCVRCAEPLAPLAVGTDLLGSSLDARKLWGTKILIGLTSLVFLGQLLAARKSGLSSLLRRISLADCLRFGAMPISLEDVQTEPYRLLSAVFVHFGVLHFAMNMLSLGNIGRTAEPGIGTARFIVAYLATGVVGFAANIAVDLVFPTRGAVPTLTAGASGAVFGAMGLILGWLLRMKDRRWRSFAIQAAFYALLVNLLGLRINNGAHIGGLLCGAAFGFYYASRPRPKSLLVANIAAALGLLLSLASLVLAQRAAGWGATPLGEASPPLACAFVPRDRDLAQPLTPPTGAPSNARFHRFQETP